MSPRELFAVRNTLLISLFLLTGLAWAPKTSAIEPPDPRIVVAATPAELAQSPLQSARLEDDEDSEPAVEITPPPHDSLALSGDVLPEVREEYEAALELYMDARKNFQKDKPRKDAIRAWKRLVKKLPGGQAHYYLGILYQWDREFRKARKILEELIDLHPQHYEGLVELGDVYVWEKDREKAIPFYEKALAIYPFFEYGVDRMMLTLVELGRFEEAATFVERALQRGPNPTRLRCQQAVQFAIEGPEWDGREYKVETDNYIIRTDVSNAFAEEIADTAELIRELYDSLFPEIEKSDRKYLVYVFKDRAGYLRAGAPEQSGGVYMSLSRRLMLYKKETMESTLMTLKHEGFHQYCHEYLDNIPSWFNEGLADTFAATELVVKKKKRSMRLLPNSERITYLKRALRGGNYPSLAKLMNMTQREMYDVENDGKMMYLHYCQAWGICYFCITGKSSKYRASLKTYFKLLRKGKTGSEAYESTFGRLNMRKFQEEWTAYMLSTGNGGS